MAERLLAQGHLDHLYLLPTRQNIGKDVIASNHRLAMLRLALMDRDRRLSIDTRELEQIGTTYTIETLRNIRAEYPSDHIHFIMGMDALAGIEAWKQPWQLTDYAHLIIIERSGYQLPKKVQDWLLAHQLNAKEWNTLSHGGIQLCTTDTIDCSSTEGSPENQGWTQAITSICRCCSLYQSGEFCIYTHNTQQLVINALLERKAKDILVLDVASPTSICDQIIIATVTSNRQALALIDNLTREAKKASIPVLGSEGQQDGEWMLVDLAHVVVHIMMPDARDFYQLEKLLQPLANQSRRIEESEQQESSSY